MAKKQLDKEDKVITKINNKYELVAYIFRYRTKELLAVLVVILTSLVLWFYFSETKPEDVKNKIEKVQE